MQSNVKSRLIEFLKFKSISQKAFAQSVGVSAGFVNAIRVSIQPKTLEKISNVYPDLNITWLLTGVGPMLLDVAPPAQVSSVNSAVAMHGNAINTITNESAGGDSSVSQELKMAQQKIEALEKLLNEKERLIKVLLDKK
nr:MAG TPA: SOS-response transcriptional repressor [Caudoviricetes sp.]